MFSSREAHAGVPVGQMRHVKRDEDLVPWQVARLGRHHIHSQRHFHRNSVVLYVSARPTNSCTYVPCREVGLIPEIDAHKTLIVSQVQIRLSAVIEHENLLAGERKRNVKKQGELPHRQHQQHQQRSHPARKPKHTSPCSNGDMVPASTFRYGSILMAVGLSPIILHSTPMLEAVTPLPMPLKTPPGRSHSKTHRQGKQCRAEWDAESMDYHTTLLRMV